MRPLVPNAVLASFFLACCWLLLGAPGTADAQPSPPRSVVLKPAPPHAGASTFSSALWETHAPHTRLDTTQRGDSPRDRWLAMDKAKHLGGSFLVVLGGQYVFEEKAALRRNPALALSLSTGAAVGLGKELYDWRYGAARHFSAKDLAADALGLLLAVGVVVL